MSAIELDTNWPTIASVCEPLEKYRELLSWGTGGDTQPSDCLSPLGLLLAHLIISFLPGRPRILDLCAMPTCGASTAFALTHPRVRQVVSCQGSGEQPWHTALT